MDIQYNKAVGIAFLVLGIVLTSMNLIPLTGGILDFLHTAAVISIILGAAFLRGTYFTMNEDCLMLRTLIGSAGTTYKFASIKDLSVEDDRVFLNQNGKRQKISISAWMADADGWRAFVQKIKDSA